MIPILVYIGLLIAGVAIGFITGMICQWIAKAIRG